jgi:predicted phosphodiesterase
MECALRQSLGDVYTSLSPMQELEALTELLRPIAPKTIGIVPGNHEDRHYKTNGVDMTRLLARQLGIESKYSEDAAVIFLRFGRNEDSKHHNRPISYSIYLIHGFGGGRKEGGKLQRLADLADIIDCDIYICGHTHLPAALKVDFHRTSPANSSISYAPHLFVNAAAKLDYGGYGCKGGYKPANKDTPIILLDGTKKNARAVI